MSLQFNRFNNIYPDRDSAIDLLNSLSRSYSEGVTIRYYEDSDYKKLGIIFVIYKSEEVGDYEIVYESGKEIPETSFRIFEVTRQYEGQSDEDCIGVALFGQTPINRDMVIISSVSGNTTVTYIFFNEDWIRIGTDGSELGIINTNTVNLTISQDNDNPTNRSISADVKIDNSSLIYDSTIDKIRINKIYGGTF